MFSVVFLRTSRKCAFATVDLQYLSELYRKHRVMGINLKRKAT